jgi:Tfp pilus assembly protein PilF
MTRSSRSLLVGGIAAVLAAGLWFTFGANGGLPRPGSDQYEAVTRAFYRGLAELDVGLIDAAITDFTEATTIVPDEPASWANLGLAHLRLGSFEAAEPALARAAALAPGDGRVAFLLSRLEASRGEFDAALTHLQRAIELDPDDVTMRMTLVEEVERSGQPGADDRAQALLDEISATRPGNLFILVERARLAARRDDAASFRTAVDGLAEVAATWPEDVRAQFALVQAAATDPLSPDAAVEVAFLRNVLMTVPAFVDDRRLVVPSVELIADPLFDFVRLTPVRNAPDEADTALTYAGDAVSSDGVSLDALVALSLDGVAPPVLVATGGGQLHRLGPGDTVFALPSGARPSPGAMPVLAPLDWNHDFRLDLAVAATTGVVLFVQEEDGSFSDVTAAAGAGMGEIGIVTGVWAADVEMDGDVDIVAARQGRAPVVLRNNGDGTWSRTEPFAGAQGIGAFSWGDVDADGDPDAVVVDEGGVLRVFENLQGGVFQGIELPSVGGPVNTVAIADLDSDGRLDILAVDAAGALSSTTWRAGQWASRTWASAGDLAGGEAMRIFVADLDNNGALDVVVSATAATRIWLGNEQAGLVPLEAAVDAHVAGVVDLDGDGVLDLVGLADGRAMRLTARATRGYHYQVVRPRAIEAAGDQRINTFGVGGVVEVRSGRLVQKHLIEGPVVHVGIGARTAVDVTRIGWPNGVPQAEFDPQVDTTIVAEQRLKGSCPWVFADNGREMAFVTDFLWRSPLGLRINAAETAGVAQTEDWIRIGSEQLAAREGTYDVRITAELWETHYIDHVSLMTVDHPSDIEVFVDERFVPGAVPRLEVHAVRDVEPVRNVRDQDDRDVTDLVAVRDGRYLDTFALGAYQGIAGPHWVAFDVPERPEGAGRWWIVAHGWVYPTDSSINMAIGQGGRIRPEGLALDVLDGSGRWVTVAGGLGFPAGKNKTVLIDLAPLEAAGFSGARRVRLRTNLEIYWDAITTAQSADSGALRVDRILPSVADLRYRGFSVTSGSRRTPETPVYEQIANTRARWRDLAGLYTRFGDVRELVNGVEDRYVIMNAGDELRLSFPAPPDPPEGWTRDFVLVGDGWNKDGDFNTSYSRTVLPLPAHDAEYVAASTEPSLAGDPVYRRYRDDWLTYHTRYVDARPFVDGLASGVKEPR